MLFDPLDRNEVRQLLQDAGCPEEFILKFLNTMDTQRITDQLKLLKQQRFRQLERLHTEGKRLDKLDFLRSALEQNLKPGRGKK